jgi:hypothetical protein
VHRVYTVHREHRECEKYTVCTMKGSRVTIEFTESVYEVNVECV